jgi:hypothetical protein
VNVKAFFVDALGRALELELGTPDDVLRHVTPDILAQHLPRPLWARLLTACLGAPRVDARLVVDTIGVPNLCEHVPAHLIWAVIADIAERALGVVVLRTPASSAPSVAPTRPTPPQPLVAPPPELVASASRAPTPPAGRPIPAPGNQPLSDLIDELEADERPTASDAAPRSPRPLGSSIPQRFRPNQTNANRNTVRRPQVAAPAQRPLARRGSTEVSSDVEADTEIGKEGWEKDAPVAVDDSQLVDWAPMDTSTDRKKS